MNERSGAERLARAWLRAIAGTSYVPMSRAELLDFFSASDTPFAMKKDKKVWAKVQTELEELKRAPAEQKAAEAGQ